MEQKRKNVSPFSNENRNAYGDPRYAEVVRAMKEELLRLREEVGDTDEANPRMREIIRTNF